MTDAVLALRDVAVRYSDAFAVRVPALDVAAAVVEHARAPHDEPFAVVFAAIGAGWAHQPILALAVSYVLPIVLLPVALFILRLGAR